MRWTTPSPRDSRPDALYFDGYAFHGGHREDFSPDHPVSRKLALEKQIECFRETRKRGIIPGAELARFWCVSECDYFFFTDWSRDRLAVGEPIPWFQLVFHECYAACFSGGGYGRYDWPEDKNPRLYELLFAAAPGYNWMLPYGDGFPGAGLEDGVPIRAWGTGRMRRAHPVAAALERLFPENRPRRNDLSPDSSTPNAACSRFSSTTESPPSSISPKGSAVFRAWRLSVGDWEKPHEGRL